MEHVYAYTRGPARTILDDYYRANNPFEIAKPYVIVPTVTSLLRLSPTSWQLRWTEEQRGPDGLLLGKSPVGGRRHHRDRTAALGGRDPDEPLGLYVTDLSWAKQL